MASADRDRPQASLADFVGVALAPVLVMALVGSLVFFLLEVCYSGAFVERMRWTLFFFVVGIVLVCRISMLPGISDRSWLYGIFLAGSTWICLQAFIEYPPGSAVRELAPVINVGLIAVVWWSARKLVWDCTNIDESADMTGEGLLSVSGLERPKEEPAANKPADDNEKSTTTTGISWWERYQRYKAEKAKKRALGVWVIYFSLAALPLFGLGQTLIPVTETSRRQLSFWFLAAYVASGLGLLMTTCFLGLRRYLRQRRLKMPASMTGVWLLCGVVLIVCLLGAGAVIPRPQSEYPLFDWQRLTGGEKMASKNAMMGDSPGQGEGRSANSANKPGEKSQNSNNNDGQGQSQDKNGGSSSDKKNGESGGDRGEGKRGSGNDKSQGGESGKNGRDGRADKNNSPSNNNSSRQAGDRQQGSDPERKAESNSTNSAVSNAAKILKWIVFAIVGLITVGVVLFAIVRFLANFTGWADRLMKAWARFWERLFGRRDKKGTAAAALAELIRVRPSRPFSSFHNPYRLGQRWSPLENCCYTFAAFEAWAREHGVARQPGETPLEHAERLGDELPEMQNGARRLALIYARGVYGRDELPEAVNDVLRDLWEQLESGARQPMSV
jgi:hypothetical protein